MKTSMNAASYMLDDVEAAGVSSCSPPSKRIIIYLRHWELMALSQVKIFTMF